MEVRYRPTRCPVPLQRTAYTIPGSTIAVRDVRYVHSTIAYGAVRGGTSLAYGTMLCCPRVWCYAGAMECPVLSAGMVLRGCYGMPGTER
eukprot:2080363-Rhodomonas_salina.1